MTPDNFAPRKRLLSDFTAGECAEIAMLRRAGRLPRELAEQFRTTQPTIRKIYQREIFA